MYEAGAITRRLFSELKMRKNIYQLGSMLAAWGVMLGFVLPAMISAKNTFVVIGGITLFVVSSIVTSEILFRYWLRKFANEASADASPDVIIITPMPATAINETQKND